MSKKYLLFFVLVLALAFSATLLAQNLTPMEQLGKEIFFDKISSPDNQSCAACHGPSVGFTGPIPGINKKGAVYPGAVRQRFGDRKPPSAAYATPSPVFFYDTNEELFIGGNFWDGRATGEHLGNPAADQALGPFLNPVEQNNPTELAVLQQIATSKYVGLWEEAWGEPLTLDPNKIDENYDRVGLAIAAYEASSEVNQYSSKFDYFQAGLVGLTPEEELGLELFNAGNDNDGIFELGEGGNCAACHPSEVGPYSDKPLFTDFSFDNLGVPKNPDNPQYAKNPGFIDPGLGGFLENHPNEDWAAMADDNYGKHKVPTLRNVDKRPGNGFTKAYMHNGVFKSLKEVTHFYNTRDVGNWPPPEVGDPTMNVEELGNLGLTDAQEDAIVAFMKTLSDGYTLPKPKNAPLVIGNASLAVIGPNPFNPTTRFSYTLPNAADIRIDVYNIVGQKVATLASGPQAAGEYKVDFNARDLASGIYLVRFQTGKEVLIQKVTLIK